MASDDEVVNGTVVQGEDGAVYFIPDDDLAGFRVTPDEEQRATEAIEASFGDEVGGFGKRSGGEPLPGVTIRTAVHGAIGTRPTMDSNTILHVDPVALYGPKGI